MTVRRTGKNGKGAPRGPNRGAAAIERPLREDLVRALVLEAYGLVRGEGRVADRTLAAITRRERRLYASERRALADTVYALLRSESRLEFLLHAGLGEALERLSGTSRHALLLAALRVARGEAPPARALAEAGLARSLLPGLAAVAEPGPHLQALAREPAARLSVEHALPRWIADVLVHDLGEEAAFAIARSMNERAPLTVRANRLKIDRDELAARLQAEDAHARPTRLAPDGLSLDARVNLLQTRAFREGLFEIQDEGSQLLALLVDPHPGWLVVDACAGAGGKTLALAATMKNRGRIVALDTDARRLAELRPRANRAGVHSWESHVVPEDGLPPELARTLEGRADAVLIDAPCSGLGVLRRNPDARFRLTPDALSRFAHLQLELLLRFAKLARPGGRIVYATCSVTRAENEEVIAAALAADPSLLVAPVSTVLPPELAAEVASGPYLRTLPHRHGTDGFFGAVLVRGQSAPTRTAT